MLAYAWPMLEDLPPYGGADADARREQLHHELTTLPSRCDLREVVWALWDAKLDAMAEDGIGQAIDHVREWGQRRQHLDRELDAVVRRLRAFSREPLSVLIRATAEGQPVRGWWNLTPPTTLEDWRRDRPDLSVPAPADVQIQADRLLDAVRADPVFTHQFSVPPRRSRRGRPAKSWRAQAHARLVACRVPKASREALLEAIGLTRPA